MFKKAVTKMFYVLISFSCHAVDKQSLRTQLVLQKKSNESFIIQKTNMKSAIFSILLLSTLTINAMAQDAAPLRKKNFNLEKDIAIQGYDPVAYFKQGKAVKGKDEFSTLYRDVVYNFSSADSKDAFIKNPSAYEPQYGGWCAFAMGKNGEKVEVNPETFKIINHKLYLFYNKYFNNTLKSWNKDESNLKAKADVNWQKIYH